MQPDEIKRLVKDTFIHVIEDMNATEETYAKYFAKGYLQYVNGETLNYNDFVSHMIAQKKVMQSIKVTIKHITVENDQVATIHLVEGTKKDGSYLEVQVNAFFIVQDKKFILCDELTHLIKGEKSDHDLGSRR